MQYTVWIVSPPNYIHSQAFAEIATSLNAALIELGHESKIVTSSFECRGRTIILAANLLSHIPALDWPKDMVIWNFEQIFSGSQWLTKQYLAIMRRENVEVWDYSAVNIEALGKMGIAAKLVEVGYMPSMQTIPEIEQDIDILHYGSVTDRRMKIINELTAIRAKVHFAFGCYGEERDRLIARSKIVLNVHFYESKVFEIARCSYLFANRKCVVSETGLDDGEYRNTGGFCEYDRIVEYCMAFLRNNDLRQKVAQSGFDIFSARSQVEFLRGVV